MTVLKVAQEVAGDIGLPVMSALVINTNQDAVRIRNAMRRAGRQLARKNWIAMTREALVTTSLATATQDMPTDFRAMLPNSMWNRTEKRRTKGPVRPAFWQDLQSGPVSGLRDTVSIRVFHESGTSAKKLVFEPAPGTAHIYAFEYRSNSWLMNSAGNDMTATIDEDGASSMIDEEVLILQTKWRVLRALGQPHASEQIEASVETEKAFAEDGGMQAINIAGGALNQNPAVTPDSSIGAVVYPLPEDVTGG